MKYYQNRRIVLSLYAVLTSAMLLTGFTSMAAETVNDKTEIQDRQAEVMTWDLHGMVSGIQGTSVRKTKETVQKAYETYLMKVEEEKAAQEAERLAKEKAAEEARAAEEAQAASVSASASEQQLLAALIFCEAGNQPYEGQVAVGAVVMNRVRSGSYPNSIAEVIYQSGQFTPAMTGWLDSVLAGGGYTDSAMQAAADALAGSNPVGECLYFSTGGYGLQIGDHFFH